jgi:hypothetical protein
MLKTVCFAKELVMIKDRNGNIIATDSAQGSMLDFLYKNAFGRFVTKLLTRKFISELGRIYMESPLSKRRISKLIKENNIDMSEYENREFSSFNDFFTRKLADGSRSFDMSPEAVIAPADSKLTAYDITEDSLYQLHFEAVAYEGGYNVWHILPFPERTERPIKPTKILFEQFSIPNNKEIELSVTFGDKSIEVELEGVKSSVTCEDFPESFHVGFTACEGICIFSEFSLEY